MVSPSPSAPPDTNPVGTLVPPNWGEFIPDLISGLAVGILVGVGVGIALYRWQRGREARDRRRNAQLQWRRAAPRLARVMRYEYKRSDIALDLPAFASPFETVITEAIDMDLVQWAIDYPDRPDLQVASRLVENSTTFVRLAAELQDQIVNRKRALFASDNNEPWQVAIALLLGLKLDRGLQPFETKGNELLNDEDVAKYARPFVGWLDQCENDYNDLWRSLRSQDSAPRTD